MCWQLAAGTDCVSLKLAEAEAHLTCVDDSSEMLAVLQDMLRDRQLHAFVHVMDVRALSLGRRFDLILFPFHAFVELLTPTLRFRIVEQVELERLADEADLHVDARYGDYARALSPGDQPAHDLRPDAMSTRLPTEPIVTCEPIVLRPATLADRRAVFEWLAHSDLTASMLGPPRFPDAPVPTWKTFCADYAGHLFDGSQHTVGRSFIIEVDGQPVGHVNYEEMTLQRNVAELDIWMRAERFCGHGYGSAALRGLTDYVHQGYGITEFVLRPSARNPRTVRAYHRAGFALVAMPLHEQHRRYGPGDYYDDVLMLRHVGE